MPRSWMTCWSNRSSSVDRAGEDFRYLVGYLTNGTLRLGEFGFKRGRINFLWWANLGGLDNGFSLIPRVRMLVLVKILNILYYSDNSSTSNRRLVMDTFSTN